MLKHILLSSCLLVSATSVAFAGNTTDAAAGKYTLDSTHTYPRFSVMHAGFSLQRGQFDQTKGTLQIDPEAKTGELDITIDAASVNTGYKMRDEHLRGKKFFNVKKYPTLRYVAKDWVFEGKTPVKALGQLTFMGVTRDVPLTIENFICGEHHFTGGVACGAEASATIKRSDFGLNYAIPMVGDDIQITIQVEASQDSPKDSSKNSHKSH